MSDDQVNIEVNGVALQARKGQMLIQVTDDAGIYIPRFCYHEKLSIAANCRMCLVEVEKAPKPLPACATPVAEGMKVSTKSHYAMGAQRATMEFLLINHPLDCPICDQGGECELQDLAMGFGRDISRFAEKKRSVKDKNLGPLVSTDMTRCIHCTRCVRFGSEIAGIQELGTLGRGENMEIGTFVERSVDHELSGNIIDLCPVGALNNKPFRFRARSWEMLQHATVSPHDGFGSNLFAHVLDGRLMRMVPRANEALNETWIADRDRFSCHGIYSDDRLAAPMLRDGDDWREVSWGEALEVVAAKLRSAADSDATNIGCLVSPSATVEEQYLAGRLLRGLGSASIDHRLRQSDFSDQGNDPLYPSLGVTIEQFAARDAMLVVGSNLRSEVPMLAHRVRSAALGGARVMFVNPAGFDYRFTVTAYLEAPSAGFAARLAALIGAAAAITGKPVPAQVAQAVAGARFDAAEREVAQNLVDAEAPIITLGLLAARHPAFADLRALASALATLTGAVVGTLSEGANSAGASLAGALPHRGPAGQLLDKQGQHAGQMRAGGCKTLLLFGVEPEADCHDGEAMVEALDGADLVVAIGPYVSDSVRRFAHVLLPCGTFAETSGTFVNLHGLWQSFSGVATPVGEARPGWKILRVLGNALGLERFDYQSSEEVRDELKSLVDATDTGTPTNGQYQATVPEETGDAPLVNDVPIYAVDALVRRSVPLQETRSGKTALRRV